ncbi:glutathione S-transferase C-terminal domain-containing protein homolog [Copidosoma floridanum]|uniref:glutathione S-transferase C-terminal domain-containing protein homolog n=1 Tax=Copidosoma floridanum TaxID=29053 RepID=UPI000C6FBC2A|nr:glutathione S-transferase C-terminal domain-containing protein homolog [Copidosoma floridanum]
MAKIYLKVFTADSLCQVPIETLITLFTIKYCNSDVQIMLVKNIPVCTENSFLVDLSTFEYELIERAEMSKIASCCELPNLEENGTSCIAGLCATLRQVIKNVLIKHPEHYSIKLLGFKEACLLACSEVSVWTRFCEIDIVSMLKSIDKQNQDSILPVSLAKFENHMSQPVRLHNLYKYTMSKKYTTPDFDKNKSIMPEHVFSEGLSITLADVMIFVCIRMFFTFVDKNQIFDVAPLTMKWYDNMLTNEHILRCMEILCIQDLYSTNLILAYSLPVIENHSLYKSDQKKYPSGNRIHTRQSDIDYSLNRVKCFQLQIHLDELFGIEKTVDWPNIPYEATPEGGNLPSSRLHRKLQQLESLCKPVLKLAKEGDVIVDFCSGCGHLGILLAYLLPKCSVILLENKSESMKKAKERVAKLSLTNVTFYQSNLDYYIGHFDIGVCLHACGVATDLVLQQCIGQNAAFVCCPCCYGSVQDCYKIIYPRSQVMKGILDKRNYLTLGHAADQTHDAENAKTKQGYECMMVIDTDRKLQAEEHGYNVHLSKLLPETCSPKNHLLVGWPKQENVGNV